MLFSKQIPAFIFFVMILFSQTLIADEYRNIDWIELMPKDDLEALSNPPEYLDQIEDGSFEDQISSQLQSALETAADDKYQQALVSTKVVKAFDNQKIRLPGFIVPIEFDDQYRVTEFFLVPFFGACIHAPPPPPNQIIYAKYDKGFAQVGLYAAYWLTGTLHISLTENDIATSAYTIDINSIEPYKEGDN